MTKTEWAMWIVAIIACPFAALLMPKEDEDEE